MPKNRTLANDKKLLVIEDGTEYEEFARAFLSPPFEVHAAHSAEEALHALGLQRFEAMLIDLRFERAAPEQMIGDLDAIAERLFSGDRTRALRWVTDEQGALILGALRAAGHAHPALFVRDFPPRRLSNLKRLYGAVSAVPRFDAAGILAEFQSLGIDALGRPS